MSQIWGHLPVLHDYMDLGQERTGEQHASDLAAERRSFSGSGAKQQAGPDPQLDRVDVAGAYGRSGRPGTCRGHWCHQQSGRPGWRPAQTRPL